MGLLTIEQQQLEKLLAMDDSQGPICMLNLLRFKAQAEYREGSGDEPCSGAEAYQRYGEATGKILAEVGGSMRYMAPTDIHLIAAEGERWDLLLLVDYPDIAAFKALFSHADYAAAHRHRDAACEDSRLIMTIPEA